MKTTKVNNSSLNFANLYNVSMMEMAVFNLSADLIHAKKIGDPPKVREGRNMEGLQSLGAGPCIIIAVRDKKSGDIGMFHLAECDEAKEALMEFHQFLIANGIKNFRAHLIGGNDDTDFLRDILLTQTYFPVTDTYKNTVTDDLHSVDVFLTKNEMRFVPQIEKPEQTIKIFQQVSKADFSEMLDSDSSIGSDESPDASADEENDNPMNPESATNINMAQPEVHHDTGKNPHQSVPSMNLFTHKISQPAASGTNAEFKGPPKRR